MAFCGNCGFEVQEYDKFCPRCGVATRKDYFTGSSYKSTRKETYDGEIKKCPHCGEVLKSFEAHCPTCGYELRNANTANYILEFSKKLEATTSVEQKNDLIRHFVMPNTKEDIYEFMILAATNVETNGPNTNAWFVKMEQAYQKAKIVFSNSSELEAIEKIYNKACQEYKKVKRSNSFSSFFSNHTKGVVLFILGFLATVCYSVSIIGSLYDESRYSIFSSFGFAFCIAIIIIAIKWKKKV